MQQSATYRGTREDLERALVQLPAILAGQVPDPWGIVYLLQVRLGMALVEKIRQAFVIKARGGTDACGITWPALKRATIAGRRPPSRKKRGARPRGLLTAAQDKRWRKIFGSRMAQLMLNGMDPASAKRQAAQIAWTILKSEGAKTRLDLLGGRQVPMLRDTGELYRAFTPGLPGTVVNQIFRVTPGEIVVGVNKKGQHHEGIPGRLPARPYWPLDGSLPDVWWDDLMRTLQRGLLVALADVITRGAA